MEEPLHRPSRSKVALNKRICYFLVFLFVAVPVVVGVVVWHLTKTAYDNSDGASDGTQAGQVGGTTSGCPTQPEMTTVPATEQTTQVVSDDEPWKNLRLPKYVIPIHYDITLYPDFYGDHGWFYGNETAELNVTKATKVFLIHTNYMNITKTTLNYAGGSNIAIANTFWYAENQFWVVQTKEPVRSSVVHLHLQFDGSLTRAIVGFYKSSYTNSKTGEIR